MTTQIKRTQTSEQNVSDRHIEFDVYVDGEYVQSFDDVCDALDFVEELESNEGGN